MKRALSAILLLSLSGCVTFQMGGTGPSACVPQWSGEFAGKLATEADALPADATTREALAQLVELRKALPRC